VVQVVAQKEVQEQAEQRQPARQPPLSQEQVQGHQEELVVAQLEAQKVQVR